MPPDVLTEPPSSRAGDPHVAEPTWYGFTDPATLSEEGRATFAALADASRDGRWPAVFAVLDADPRLVNVTRPGGTSG